MTPDHNSRPIAHISQPLTRSSQPLAHPSQPRSGSSQPSSRPSTRNRAAVTRPLLEFQVYRPSSFLALTILMLPVAATLIGAVVSLNVNGAIPVWLPFLVLLWIPCLPVLWFVMQSARTSSMTFAVGRPWRPWVDLPWDSIERVEQSGFTIRATASDGRRVAVRPFLLHDGNRLRREFLLRLPTNVLTGTLGQEAKRLLVADIQLPPDGVLLGTLHAHPKNLWRNLAGILGGVLLGAGVLSIVFLGVFPGIGLGLCAILLGLVCIAAFIWLLQEILINEHGINRRIPLRRQTAMLEWGDIDLIEYSSREYVLRLRGSQRFICAGPSLLPIAERDLMRAYIHEYAISKGIPTVRRTWIFF